MTGATLVSAILEILYAGISTTAEKIGAGLSTLAENIFFTTVEGTQSISVLGTMILAFAGVSLAISICRKVLMWLGSLGGKNL